MPKPSKIRLPRLAVEDKTEKVIVVMTEPLKIKLERFEAFFTEHAGLRPSSFNALIVGLLEEYVDGHRGFQKWNKARHRSAEVDA
jgi:hypothetical protein